MKFNVKAGPHTYVNCPIKCAVEGLSAVPAHCTLIGSNGADLPSQVWSKDGDTYFAWIEPRLRAGEEKTYAVDFARTTELPGVEIRDTGDLALEVSVGGSRFTCYNYSDDYPRPFLYPFHSHDGAQVTRNFPMRNDIAGEDTDHKHHRSVWIAYGDVNGTDNWCENEGHGWIRHRAFDEVTSGPVFGRIKARSVWTSPSGEPQMSDEREFTIYNVGNERLMDIRVSFIATECDVLLKDTKEGGIVSVRVASSMDGSKAGMIVNSYGGRTEAETWGRPAQWVDYYGPVNGKTYGITLMDHPDSFRYPTRWHVRDYGLFTANPFALKAYEPERDWCGDYTISKGERIDFRYRLLVHEGDAWAAGIGDRYFGFAAPPTVQVEN